MSQSNDKGKSAVPAQKKPAAAPPAPAASQHEQPCPECGEMVRKGLVRCWNCGAFMNATMQARYQEMQSNPAPPIFSQVPDSEVTSVETATEDDFQLGSNTTSTSRQADLRDLEPITSTAAPAPVAPAPAAEPPAGTAHSIATAGDVLFAAAMQEQVENRERRKKRGTPVGGAKTPGGFIIFCPYGCRIEVKEQHRGMQGRCPRCRAPFFVPLDPPDFSSLKQAVAAAAETAATTAVAVGRQWFDDLHVHVVPPEKLKLKADSLLKDFTEQDFAFTSDGFVRISLAKKAGGLFGGGADKKKAETRTAVRVHLQENKPLSAAPGGDSQSYTAEHLQELRVVQPAASRAQSLFHGIPVFGAGRIAVMLPLGDDGVPNYVSLGITQFRKLADFLRQVPGLEDFGAGCGIPATDEFDIVGKCHYQSTPVKSLKNLEFYQADPTVQVIVAGWKCDKCPVVMSEEGRARAKFGGKDGKGIAKTKCPKCNQKFGNHPLYVLKDAGGATPSKPEEPQAESPAPAAAAPAATA
ncbi:MAG: hypothetical protein JNG89_14265 [Planctomycetaceae bacterium]|nr:hypothetical protein [Planctomycetaceae bacterium]